MRGLSTREQVKIEGLENTFRDPSPRRAAWWLLKEEKDLKEDERAFVDQLNRLCPEIVKVRELGQSFQKMIKERKAKEYEGWKEAATTSQIKEMEGFAEGLNRDREEVRGALQSKWSNGQVEGQVNRLKLIKRQMYGRAKFDLLKARVLYRG